ncbi:Apple domain-containing protein [Caenorhabditis elegans]|uniref:Apple domain-containing protein n=1 Tax=Caenorhabditis elegans TaxID=6239 RepID=Q22815_CAEEL|nr:Apple domain-containing protein [Caenorhabditis elegans]CAA90727.3 Apple domain-containing protein [Caenorhabditis elegans]|eukprot:NP_495968.3 Uncharacterized protein CELE_T26C5.2 [Caenorhabditis elegans]
MRIYILLAVFISSCLADTSVLRPCFERYPNHRLVNVRPYHSEWRMKTEDMCLLFCAQSASRCRSVVYDTVQHICHYFSDEGVDQAILSAKMTYLRVVSQSCLQESSEIASDPKTSPPDAPPTLLPNSFNSINEIQQDIHEELAIPQPPTEEEQITSTEASIPEVVTFETATQEAMNNDEDLAVVTTEKPFVPPTSTSENVNIDEEDLDAELKSVMEQPSQFTGSFADSDAQIDNNGVYRDKTSSEQRWMNSMEKMDVKPSETKKSIDEKLEDLKTENKDKYEMLMGTSQESDPEVAVETQKLKNNLRYGAKVIKFDEEAAFRKQSELRRKPVGAKRRPDLKPVTISSTSYIQKAKSFLDEVNEEEENENIIETECQQDDVDVWIAFENSAQAEESENVDIDSNVPNKRECEKICKEKNCRSYTYFEKTHTCHLSTKSDGVTIKAPPSGDFTATTSTKFCYPRTFSVFDGCSNFVAFRDYSVRIEAVEEFNDLPKGYDGMQLCIELCVLSTKFTCRSSTFNPITGQCRLMTEDSMTSPDSFEYDEFQKALYFENGCTNAENETPGSSDRNVEIVEVKPKKMKHRSIKIKKIRRRRH